jgi:ribosome-binding factor A
MPREFSRSQRMAEQLRRELAEIIRDEIKDPRLGFVSFTEVRLSRDLSHAVIYCSVFHAEGNSVEKQQESIEILNHAVGFIRKEVASRIRARIVPTLKFVIDDSISRGEAMDELISEAIRSDKSHGADED